MCCVSEAPAHTKGGDACFTSFIMDFLDSHNEYVIYQPVLHWSLGQECPKQSWLHSDESDEIKRAAINHHKSNQDHKNAAAKFVGKLHHKWKA